MQKAKRNTPVILDNFWVKSAEFTSEFSVEECADRLARRNEPKRGFFITKKRLKVTLDYDHQDALYTFIMSLGVGRNYMITAQGYLDAMDDHHTSVYVKTQQRLLGSSVFCLIGVVFLFVALMSPQLFTLDNVERWFVVLAVGMLFVNHFTLITVRNELIRVVEDTLAPEKPKNQS